MLKMQATKKAVKSVLLAGTLVMVLLIAFNVTGNTARAPMRAESPVILPETLSPQYIASLDVARVFGRSSGCADADPKLIEAVASESLRAKIDPRILAALVAVESSCDPMAVSKRGAIGYTQVMPKVWANKFDFANTVNLFNPHDNLHAGATILGDLIKQYGITDGVRRYQGLGVSCPSCDDNYVPKILALAGRKEK